MAQPLQSWISQNWILRMRLLATSVALGLAILATPSTQAQTYTKTILHNFTGTDGWGPGTRLIMDKAGNLYGTTEEGGNLALCNGRGCGVVFKVDAGGKETVLHAFTGPDGAVPMGRLTMDATGNLYGTTSNGGAIQSSCFGGCGTVFKLDTSGTYTVLYNFRGHQYGEYPRGGLLLVGAGYFFGTAAAGGIPCELSGQRCGVVFKLAPTSGGGSTYTVLYRFAGPPDGALPAGEVTRDTQAYLYGTTTSGGASDNGTVFKVRAHKESVVYRFAGGADGDGPIGGLLLDSAGNLFGATYEGGDMGCGFNDLGCGTVYKLDTSGKKTILYAFIGGTDGAYPTDRLVTDSAGNLYGTTGLGGGTGCFPSQGCGTVFKLDKTGKEALLYTFLGGGDGYFPAAGLAIDAAGNLYGTTAAGGGTACDGYGCGTVFKLTPQ